MSVRPLSSAARYRPIVYVISREATTTTICAGVLEARFGARLDVRVMGSLEAGFAALERIRPTLILADWRLDGAYATALIERTRETTAFRAIPLIVIADPRDESRPRRFEDIGAIDTLWRPLRTHRVVEVCAGALTYAQVRTRGGWSTVPSGNVALAR